MAKKKTNETRAESSPLSTDPIEDSEDPLPSEKTRDGSVASLKNEGWFSFTDPQQSNHDYLEPIEEKPNPVTPLEYDLWPTGEKKEIDLLIAAPTEKKSPKRNHMEFFSPSLEPPKTPKSSFLPDRISHSFPQSMNETEPLSIGINHSAPPTACLSLLPRSYSQSEYEVWPFEEEKIISPMTESTNQFYHDYVAEPPLEQNENTEKYPIRSTELGYTPSFTEQIGEGKFSRVYKDTYENQVVAIKIPAQDFQGMVHLRKENFIYSRLQQIQQQSTYCPNIVSMHAFDSEHTWLILEWMEKSSLDKLLSIKPQPLLSIDLPNQLMRDILQGTAFLHEHHIIHRDLKPGNVLLNNQYRAKLADFGIALEITESSDLSPKGDISWMAPEVLSALLYQLPFTSTLNNDIYNIAVIFLMIICWRSEPYQTTQNSEGPNPITRTILDHDLMEDIRTGKRDEMPTITPFWLKNMVCQSLNKDPQNRPSAKQLLQTILHHGSKDTHTAQSSTSSGSRTTSPCLGKG